MKDEMVRSPYTQHRDDNDFVQANALINQVMDDAARERLVNNVVGHLSDGVSEPVLERAFEYWKQIDPAIGERIEAGIRNG